MLFRIKLFDFCTFNIKPYTFLLINILQVGRPSFSHLMIRTHCDPDPYGCIDHEKKKEKRIIIQNLFRKNCNSK